MSSPANAADHAARGSAGEPPARTPLCFEAARPQTGCTPSPPHGEASVAGLEEPLQGGHELVDVLEIPIHRGEAYERHLVELPKALHQQLPDLVGRDLAVRALVDHRLDAVPDTLAPPPDHVSLLALAGVNDLVLEMGAERALQGSPSWLGAETPTGPSPATSATRARLRPSRRRKKSPKARTGRLERAWATVPAALADSRSTPSTSASAMR